jgi:segregation and condensation protein B
MEEQDSQQVEIRPDEPVTVEELIPSTEGEAPAPIEGVALRAVIEALIYVAEEPLTVAQIATALSQPAERVQEMIAQLAAEFEKPEHGVAVREVAGGYKIATKAEHHEAVRAFAKSLKPPLKLSLAALETLAVIAYKQPVTVPEIQEIRGVQGAGVVKTLLDRKLVVPAGRKNVVGKPILYKTTKEFLIQFGLKDLSELPSLKEFEEIRRMAFADSEPPQSAAPPAEADAEKIGPQIVPEPISESVPAADSDHAGSGSAEAAESAESVSEAVPNPDSQDAGSGSAESAGTAEPVPERGEQES